MAIKRLRISGETRNSVADIWGERTPYEGKGNWESRVDAAWTDDPERWVQSCCVLCSNGCGLDIGVKDNRIVAVRGREDDSSSRGRLGPKGLHGWLANHSPDRLTRPLIKRGGSFHEASWEEAMDLMVSKAKEVMEKYTNLAIGSYTTGQLFLEEYYALAMIMRAGFGTPHTDGNTRLCTATSSAALKETFGTDGQPSSYDDVDETDCILMVGHNASNTHTVLWMRILDRRRGPNPPKLVVIDPRETMTAREADIHLAPRIGTNVAVMNGLINLIIEAGQVDERFVSEHTQGFNELKKTVLQYPPERVAEIADIPPDQLRAAAQVLGSAPTLLSTALQGVYQSHQATAAACQINNLNLIRGMIGRAGCGVLQMNGQPTAENTRETGCDGNLTGFRNWHNPDHVADLARHWNVETDTIPHWSLPTHALKLFHEAASGSIHFLWIQSTNPAVSLPDLARVRDTLMKPGLFVVVQDAFMTETAKLADLVLPAAIWGEKTGTFTNTDRTVHISHKAIDPPGEARPDFDIFLDFARRMDFRDKDGAPLIKFETPEGAFEAFKETTRSRLCDYTGLSYDKLSSRSGIRWPCNEKYPDGAPRLYEDLHFWSDADVCESYGHDLITGGSIPEKQYRAHNPAGKAMLKGADYLPPFEGPDVDYPFWMSTGRVVHHFHTRTKTGRSETLHEAVPDAFIEMAAEDAARLGIDEGEMVRVTSRRGYVEAPAKIGGIKRGHLFVPFHFGYWDEEGRHRAANELTQYAWDPISKQPMFKYSAVRLEKAGSVVKHAADAANQLARTAFYAAKGALDSAMPKREHLKDYFGLLLESEQRLALGFERVRKAHSEELNMYHECGMFAQWTHEAVERIRPFTGKYGEKASREAADIGSAVKDGRKGAGVFLLRDLHDLWLLASEAYMACLVLHQAALALRDEDLKHVVWNAMEMNQRQRQWLKTRIKNEGPQSLIVPT